MPSCGGKTGEEASAVAGRPTRTEPEWVSDRAEGVTHHHYEASHANRADNEGVGVMLGLARASAAHRTSGFQWSSSCSGPYGACL